MTALLVARFNVKNAEKMNAYATVAGPTVSAHGGEFVAMGEKVNALVGQEDRQSVAMVRFPDVATAKAWFASRETSSSFHFSILAWTAFPLASVRVMNWPSTNKSGATSPFSL